MITETAYRRMADSAITKFQNMSADLSPETEIVFVVSREVYRAMVAYEQNFWNHHNNANGITGIFYGLRVGCINEDMDEDLFIPVIYSRNFQHYEAVHRGEYIIFNDDNNDRLFRLVRVTPDTMYTDTGLTVSFFEIPTNAADNAAINITNNAEDIGNSIVTGIERTIELETERAIGFTANNVYIDEDLFYELAGEDTDVLQRRKRGKEKPFNPGDTKLIDDYLHSFRKGGC